jgi:sugar phosphate isomerase/epimerase
VKLAASNIGWESKDDALVYQKLKEIGFLGIEIAPTRLVPIRPYEPSNRQLAESLAGDIRHIWGLEVCSMQSIWYGLTERIFGTDEERAFLLQYTRSAIDFAAAIGAPHLVFGCPKNRVIESAEQYPIGVLFFSECADYAAEKGVVIGLEANPWIYGTNFLNSTPEVLQLVREVDSPSLRLNLDVGTIIVNQESLESVAAAITFASHVQISEPYLATIGRRSEHVELVRLLNEQGYKGWVSLEMRNLGLAELFGSLDIMAELFAS